MVQWLRHHAPNAEGLGLIPDQGTRSHIPQLGVHIPQLKTGSAKFTYIYMYICIYIMIGALLVAQ